jgi:hypothetical protein
VLTVFNDINEQVAAEQALKTTPSAEGWSRRTIRLSC